MNPKFSNQPGAADGTRGGKPLLDTIQALRTRVGDGLNDQEFSRLLWEERLPSEAGFGFLSFAEGCATLCVPPQNPDDWSLAEVWIAPAKERIARLIAGKYQLLLSEPPDEIISSRLPPRNPPQEHHHLEFSNRKETVIVVHPFYLKVRLFKTISDTLYPRVAQSPLRWSPELLPDLATLYQLQTQSTQTSPDSKCL